MKTALTLVLCVTAVGMIAAHPLTQAQKARAQSGILIAGTPGAVAGALQAPEKIGASTKGAPGVDDANIAKFTARLLVQGHYAQKPLDDEVSSRFLDRYLEALDPMRIYFLESDIQEFEPWRKSLDDMTLNTGDSTPGHKIFARLLQRMDQQTAYVKELLKTEQFTFDGNERYSYDRDDAPRPKDLDEAKKLWRDRLRYEYLQEKLNDQKPEEIVKTITRRYDRTATTLHQYDSDEVFQLWLTSLTHVYDPHSDYMGKATFEDFDIRMRLSLFGIGAVLQSEDGYCKVVELTPGGPASKSGQLKPGDKIVKVGQGNAEPVDVVDMKLSKIVDMIRGEKGTEVRLTIIPADAADPSTRKTISLIRDEVKLEEQEAKAKIVDVPVAGGKKRLGVIDLPSFYVDTSGGPGPKKSATTDVARLIKKLTAEKVDGVILDLRKNGGGSLGEAIKLTGLFIKDGPVVQVRDSDGSVDVDRDPDPTMVYGGPLIVLTGKHSASASEILAGALQDYGRAVIVGDASTHGKGTVQTLVQLGPIMKQRGINTTQDPGALKLTIAKFYRASGSSTQLRGVVPDVILPSLNNVLAEEIGESALKNPMPWDTIPGSNFQKLNLVNGLIPELRKRSEARVQADRDFQYILEDIERYKKTAADKTVSLNEAERRKEKEDVAARLKARKEELAARPASKETVYAITLRQVDKPGLPAPTGDTTAEVKPPPARKTQDNEEPRVEGPDAHLNEAKRILIDMLSLPNKV